MVSISKTTVIQRIWENFYDLLNTNVSTVTATDSSEHAVQRYASAFPDAAVTTKASLPIIIVESPELSWQDFTLTKKWVNGTITIDVFTTKAEVADKMTDDVVNLIETGRDNLRDLGVDMVNLDSSSKEELFRGKIKVHMKSITFTWRYAFTKTQTY